MQHPELQMLWQHDGRRVGRTGHALQLRPEPCHRTKRFLHNFLTSVRGLLFAGARDGAAQLTSSARCKRTELARTHANNGAPTKLSGRHLCCVHSLLRATASRKFLAAAPTLQVNMAKGALNCTRHSAGTPHLRHKDAPTVHIPCLPDRTAECTGSMRTLHQSSAIYHSMHTPAKQINLTARA